MELNVFKTDTHATATPLNQKMSEAHKNVTQSWLDTMTPLSVLKDRVDADALLKRDELMEQSLVRLSGDLTTNDFPYTKGGLLSLNSFTPIPNSMFEYLYARNYYTDYAGYCNIELDNREIKPRASKDFLVRFREIDGVDHIRLIASDRYGIIDHDQVLKSVFYALPGGKPDVFCPSYCYDGDNLTVNILLPDYIQTKPDSEYGCGISVGNSETKAKSFTVRPFLYRASSNTHFIWNKRDSALNINIKHFGNMDFDKIRKMVSVGVETALTQGENILKLLDVAKFVPVDDALRVIATLSRDYRLTITQGKHWHQCYLNGDFQNTAFGLLNALSLASNKYDGEMAEYMQMSTLQMLTPTLVTSPEVIQKRWERINAKSHLLDTKTVEQYAFEVVNND